MKSGRAKRRLVIGLALVMAFVAGGLIAIAEDQIRQTMPPVATAVASTTK